MSRRTVLTRTLMAPALAFSIIVSSISGAAAAPVPPPVKDPSGEDLDRAGELYDNGTGLYNEGSYEGAAMAFFQAYELSGDIDLLYNVSLAYDRAENFEEALRYLEAYRALAPKEERDGLGKKVESLKVRLAKQAEREAADSQNTTTPSDRDPDATTSPGTDGPARPAPPPTDRDPGPRVFTPAAGVLTGVAVAGLAVGTGMGVSSRAASRDAQERCSGELCQRSATDSLDRAKTRAIVADVAFGVGAASAIALIVVLAVNASKRKKAGSTARLVPSHRGATFAFSF